MFFGSWFPLPCWAIHSVGYRASTPSKHKPVLLTQRPFPGPNVSRICSSLSTHFPPPPSSLPDALSLSFPHTFLFPLLLLLVIPCHSRVMFLFISNMSHLLNQSFFPSLLPSASNPYPDCSRSDWSRTSLVGPGRMMRARAKLKNGTRVP